MAQTDPLPQSPKPTRLFLDKIVKWMAGAKLNRKVEIVGRADGENNSTVLTSDGKVRVLKNRKIKKWYLKLSKLEFREIRAKYWKQNELDRKIELSSGARPEFSYGVQPQAQMMSSSYGATGVAMGSYGAVGAAMGSYGGYRAATGSYGGYGATMGSYGATGAAKGSSMAAAATGGPMSLARRVSFVEYEGGFPRSGTVQYRGSWPDMTQFGPRDVQFGAAPPPPAALAPAALTEELADALRRNAAQQRNLEETLQQNRAMEGRLGLVEEKLEQILRLLSTNK